MTDERRKQTRQERTTYRRPWRQWWRDGTMTLTIHTEQAERILDPFTVLHGLKIFIIISLLSLFRYSEKKNKEKNET